MESLLNLPAAPDAAVRLLQITDTHLFARRQETLLGVNTWDSYQAVLEAIARQRRACDLIVATGDLAQDQSVQAYHHFAKEITRLTAPCVWLPGNHDFQPAMYNSLRDNGISAAKRVLAGPFWHIILLDTQVSGVPHGEISDYQLAWLTQQLVQEPLRHTLLLLHHHPLPVGCSWLDQHSLRNAAALNEILNRHPQVTTLVCGHIHQEMDCDWNGRRLLATPSTCVQFKPHCTSFTLDTVMPGWRWLTLNPDGSLDSEVCRLADVQFIPDIASGGY